MALTPMPSLRRSIKADVSKNKALKDILPSTADALEVLSVEELEWQVHNTKTVVKVLENGIEEERVLLYDRMNLNTLLANVTAVGNTIAEMIEDLNSKGFDFTEDDLELVDNKIKAKATSLGYYNGDLPPSDCTDKLWVHIGVTDVDKEFSRDFIENACIGKLIYNGVETIGPWDPDGPGQIFLQYLGEFMGDSLSRPHVNRAFVNGNDSGEGTLPYIQNFTNDHHVIKLSYYYRRGDVFEYEPGNEEPTIRRTIIDVLTSVFGTGQMNPTMVITTRQATIPADVTEWDTVDGDGLLTGISWEESDDKMITEVAFTLCPNEQCQPTYVNFPNMFATSQAFAMGEPYKIKLRLLTPDNQPADITETISVTPATPGTEPDGQSFTVMGIIEAWLTDKGLTFDQGGGGLHNFEMFNSNLGGGDGSAAADNPGRIKRAILNVLPVVSGLAPGNPGRNNDLYLRAIDFARIESGKFILNERDEGIAVKSCGVREYEGR